MITLGLVTAIAAPQAAAAPPPGFVLLDQPTGQNAFDLTDFAYLPDGSFLSTGKSGKLNWTSTDGSTTRTLRTLSVRTEGDLGLVGVAVAPDYATSKTIYLIRSVPSGTSFTLRLAKWTVTGSPEPTGISGETTLIDLPGTSDVHGMTGIIAADDGTLWLSIGDNSDYTRVDEAALRAVDVNSLQGKILHLTADGRGVATNPYYDAANPTSARSRVFASGFRSPFRFTLDPSSGLPVAGDVGWNEWEELDLVQPGRNYAWPCWEGNHLTPGYAELPGCASVTNTAPLWEYHHGSASDQGNSITAGIVYTGNSYPEEYQGAFFFGDYVGKKLWTARWNDAGTLTQAPQNPPLATDIGGPVKFAAAPNGDIVYADIYTGNLRRLSYPTGNSTPVAEATTTTDPASRTVTFDASQSSDYDGDTLTYEWDFGDGTTGNGVTATHTYDGDGPYTAKLTVRDPLGAAGTKTFTVAPANHTPVITLTDPGDVQFAIGDEVSVSATATDAEDGDLQVTWTSTVLHCPEEATCHSHPGVGASGASFTVPFTDHPDSRMLLTATVTDSAGVSASTSYTAWPRRHRLTLQSNVPASLQIPAEGGGNSALVTEGTTLDVVAAEIASDGASTFSAWADGPTERTRTLTIGGSDITLTANYSTPIDQRYASDPAVAALLGAPTEPEVQDGNVHYRVYQYGRMYWSADTGVHEVHGSILARYLELGGHTRFGAPTTDELTTPDGVGRYNHFIGTPGSLTASVYYSPNTGTFGIWGAIREKWAEKGWEAGPLGYPVTDELVTPDGIGRYNHFSKDGSIYWSPANGAHSIWGLIRTVWQQTGWEAGPMGYPATDELVTPDGVGRYNHFDKAASIYFSPATGAHEIYGAIRARWSALGWETSYLGYPTSGEFAFDGGRRNNFQWGYIQWYPNGTVVDRRY
ncbi:glucose/arabinose dehydrogenase [Amycolatopsis endophytica]|uniref:Glucose/arabinose dehydrogenase n=1 Tax=Amycolatopsis endophytica TaxID=860233 RepID=A0A853B2F7_9PSEU|nr:glucose/arabinose dehydrogenase [Amycolatopsis endophytica]